VATRAAKDSKPSQRNTVSSYQAYRSDTNNKTTVREARVDGRVKREYSQCKNASDEREAELLG
jgi:hypothetical protein